MEDVTNHVSVESSSIACDSTRDAVADIKNSYIFNCELTPVKSISGYAQKNIKRRNSFAHDDIQRPIRTKKRAFSVDAEPLESHTHQNMFDKFDPAKGCDGIALPKKETAQLNPIIEESPRLNRSSSAQADSQNLILEYCPTQVIELEPDSSNYKTNSKDANKAVNDSNLTPELRSTSLDNIDIANCPTDVDSCEFSSDSPVDNNGQPGACYSSTPSIGLPYTPAMKFKSKIVQSNGNDSNSTPLNGFNPKKYIKSSNSSGSSKLLTNGNSVNSSIGNHVPNFDIQINCDDNKEFLSLLIVKTDSSVGVEFFREYDKLTKRITSDYAADVSKSNSSSSGIGERLLQLPAIRTSLTPSSSSSSNKTQDGTFIIPQCPPRNIQISNSTTVSGLHALKSKVDEFFTYLFDAYGLNYSHSCLGSEGKKSANNSCDFERKAKLESINGSNVVTPKSSKKKLHMKNRRPVNRLKRDILPATIEETHINGEMNSPEMIGVDVNKCNRPSTPVATTRDKSPRSMKKNKSDSLNYNSISNDFQMFKSEYCEGTFVLARWIDKNYYFGKIKQVLELNKYTIEFFDKKEKTLLDDYIIFGNSKELPIINQSVYATVESKDSYEPSLVLNLIEDKDGNVLYNCTTDRDVTASVKPSEIYVTEDQAKSIKENCCANSPHSTPTTPRRRVERDLNLDNIIQGPRNARCRDKFNNNSKKDFSFNNAKASTSGIFQKRRLNKDNFTPFHKQRQESESSEGGDCSVGRAPSTSLEEVSGVQPEIQKTPRKIEGVIVGPLVIKGNSKNGNKRSSKISKFDDDHDTNNRLGPIPQKGSTLFKDLHFILTCTDLPHHIIHKKIEEPTSTNDSSTEKEDVVFTVTPFNKERLKEQLEAGGAVVYGSFDQIPKDKYTSCKLIASRPCSTAKYVQCLAANIKAILHEWVIRSCQNNKLADMNSHALPTGWSIETERFINWEISPADRISPTPFKGHLIILCNESDNFIKFWSRVCTLAGGETRTVNEDDPNLTKGLVILAERDCPHEVQNKAIQESIPIVSTDWIVQSLIMGKVCSPDAHFKYHFNYSEAD